MGYGPSAPPPEERPHSHPLIKAPPAPAPEKPQAPCPPPENHHYHHAPGKAPFHPPEKHHYHRAPKNGKYHTPEIDNIVFPKLKLCTCPKCGIENVLYIFAFNVECPSRCEEHCKKDHHKKEEDEEEGRRCVRACTTCCCESKRAPEHKEKCKWSHMKMEGKKMKCP
ncbi:hypothetical protein RHSIM_Rhsim10G0027200 [Rhododendron simsii]|uniref:Uncharacterized protein n=1 Tax=Rhododendron simsii TaxID=118357 RepID=A0A834G9C8_RHOSS|nr:hypothetical protein RHSIM_Rhsim10G0027200 [Rhododendron simsii]